MFAFLKIVRIYKALKLFADLQARIKIPKIKG